VVNKEYAKCRSHYLYQHQHHLSISEFVVHREFVNEKIIQPVHIFHSQEDGENTEDKERPFDVIFYKDECQNEQEHHSSTKVERTCRGTLLAPILWKAFELFSLWKAFELFSGFTIGLLQCFFIVCQTHHGRASFCVRNNHRPRLPWSHVVLKYVVRF